MGVSLDGPPPETLQIEGDWEAALKKGLTKAPPPKPVKKARKRKKK